MSRHSITALVLAAALAGFSTAALAQDHSGGDPAAHHRFDRDRSGGDRAAWRSFHDADRSAQPGAFRHHDGGRHMAQGRDRRVWAHQRSRQDWGHQRSRQAWAHQRSRQDWGHQRGRQNWAWAQPHRGHRFVPPRHRHQRAYRPQHQAWLGDMHRQRPRDWFRGPMADQYRMHRR